MAKLKPELTIGQLMTRFPKGFLVSSTGHVYEVLGEAISKGLPAIENGGYVAASIPVITTGDEQYLEEIDSTEGKGPSQLAAELEDLIKRLEAGGTPEEWAQAQELYVKYRDKLPE